VPNDPADTAPHDPADTAPDDPAEAVRDDPAEAVDETAASAPGMPARQVRQVTMRRQGPLLMEGPVEIELEDGTTVFSDRFRVALCTCRRSRRYPWCDTSHRRRA
jgi:hypothetical protein